VGGSIRLRRSRRRLFVRSGAAFALGALVLALAGPAAADDPPPYTPPDGGVEAPVSPAGPEQTAQQQAEDTGQPVVVDALTTQTEQTIAQPDGSFSRTSYTKPVRVSRDGGWTPVDANLVQAPDGTYSAAATPNGVKLSGGGTGPLATLTDATGHELSFTFPAPLPAPTVTGSTAVYADVLPGVDLQAHVTDQGGFSDVLIVHNATAAANPVVRHLQLATATQGLTLTSDEAGNITAAAADGTAAYTSPTPLMWDSSTQNAAAPAARSQAVVSGESADEPGTSSTATGPGDGAQVQPVAVTTAPGSVTLAPDAELLTAPDTTYPVYIDPYTSPVNLLTGHYTQVFEGCPGAHPYNTPQDQGEGVGYQQYASNCFGLERSYYEINTSGLNSSMIIDSATLHLTETDGADHGCSNTWPLTVKATGAIGEGTDWDHQPAVSATVKASIPVASASEGCGDRSVSVDVTNQIADAAGVHATWTFGLFGNESKTSTNYGFMRFSVNPYITTVYDIPPPAPTNPSTTPDSINPAGAACDGASVGGWIGRTTLNGGNSNITLNATLSSPMTGANLRAEYAAWDNMSPGDGTSTLAIYPADSPDVASGGTAHTNIGTTVKDGHQYGWNVRAYDGHHIGPATKSCHFRVDLTPPTPAHIDDSAAFPPLGSTASPTKHAGDTGLTVHVSSTDVTPTGCTPNPCVSSGITRFEYSMDTPIPPTGAASVPVKPGSGTAAVDIPISVTAQQWGTHTLYVQAVDGAGNASPVTYSFYAPWKPGDPVEPGDLTGDGIPDTITPAPDGSLQLLSGDAGVSAAPETASGAADAPDCQTDDPTCHPDRPGWSNFLVAHRGSYTQSGVDDLLAYSRNTKMMYLYVNDAEGLTGDDRDSAVGHFTKGNVIRMSVKPACSTGDCSSYDTTWGNVQQLIAAGDATDSDGPPNVITVENGHLWFYAGSRNAAAHLSAAKLLGTGDWSGTTLIAPGAVNGTLTLWVRDNTTGLVYSYPVPLGADKLPTTVLTPPTTRPLISGVTAGDGSPLCADVMQGIAGNSTPIQMYSCNNTSAQSWTLGTDKTVRILGRCLDVTSGGTAAGTPVQLYQCNYSTAQEWVPGADGTLRNPLSGRCLTDPSNQATPGTQLVLGDCVAGGTPGQKWTVDTAGTAPVQEPLLPLNLSAVLYPTVTSPGDANTPGSATPGARDGAPDLYVADVRGRVVEYPGAPAVGDLAQFTTPVELGYLAGTKAPATAEGDLNGDTLPDFAAVDTDGHLRIYTGNTAGREDRATRSDGAGWAGADISHHGDYNGDGYEDVIAHMPASTTLRLYPGDGDAGNAQHPYTTIARPAGSPTADWSATGQVIAAGDVNLDAFPDLLAVQNDVLYLYPGTSPGTDAWHLGAPTVIGTGGWNKMDLMIPGDVNGDGLNDLWARDRTTGKVLQYLNDPTRPGIALGSGARAMTIGVGFTTTGTPGIAAPGDASGDGHPDLWATWSSDDHLHYYPGNGKAGTGAAGYGFGTQTDLTGNGWTSTIERIS
jgi:hypothetical protein